MHNASDLLPPDVVSWILTELQEFRVSEEHGFLQLQLQHGRISGLVRSESVKYPFKDKEGKKSPKQPPR